MNESYEWWSHALADAFFPLVETPRPVYFAVDDDFLDEIAGASEPGSGAESLVNAVRPRLNTHDPLRLFDPVAQEAYAWVGDRRAGSTPPFLAALAVTILAASRMDEADGVSAANYYVRLRDTLRLPAVSGTAFRGAISSAFRVLDVWLRGLHQHRRGLSTIPTNPSPAHVGFPLSQVMFRASDRRKLSRFFRLHGLKAADSPSAGLLLTPLRIWAEGARLSPGAMRLLRSPALEAEAVDLLVGELASWDESERDERGRPVGAIRLLLDVLGQARWSIVATRPAGFPQAAVFRSADGWEIELRSTIDGFYDPIRLDGRADAMLRELFSGSLVLTCNSGTLRFSGPPVIPLGPDPSVGMLASTRAIQPGERHWVLVRPALETQATSYFKEFARDGWKPRPEIAPTQWRLFSDVFVDVPPARAVDDALKPLIPSVQARPELVGGLRLGRGRRPDYLERGEPDLWVPEWLSRQDGVETTVDGIAIEGMIQGGRFALHSLNMTTGIHRASIGPYDLEFRSVQGMVSYPFSLDRFCVVTAPLRQIADPPTSSGRTWTVCGATVIGESPAFDAPRPIHVPYGAKRYAILGKQVGQVEEFEAPTVPSWLVDIGVVPKTFEIYVRFEVAWLLIDWRFSGWAVREVSTAPLADLQVKEASDRWMAVVLSVGRPERAPVGWAGWVDAAEGHSDG